MEICSSSSSPCSNKRAHSESSSSSEDGPIQKKPKLEDIARIKSIFQRALELREQYKNSSLAKQEEWDEWREAEDIAVRLCSECNSEITSQLYQPRLTLGCLSYFNVLEGYLNYPFLFYTCKHHGRFGALCPQHTSTCGNDSDGLYVTNDPWSFGVGYKHKCKLFDSPSRNMMWNARIDYHIDLCKKNNLDYPFLLYQFLGWIIGKWWKRCIPKRKKLALQRAKAVIEATALPDAVVQFVVLAYDTALVFSKTT